MARSTQEPLALGAWARAGDLTGVVAAADADTVTLFDPGRRRMARVPHAEAVAVETGAVTVSLRVDLPLPHGLGEDALARWVASLADPAIRERARDALAEEGLDEGALLPEVRLDVEPAATSGAVCLCGARTPAPDGTHVVCRSCGREAAARPPRSSTGDVLGIGLGSDEAPRGDSRPAG